MITSQHTQEDVLTIDREAITLSDCIDRVSELLQSVYRISEDYYSSSPCANIFESLSGGSGADFSFSLSFDLKALGVVAAIAQAPIVFSGGTDEGKTAIAERILSGLFGPYGSEWWAMEVNRGVTIDDLIDYDYGKLTKSKLSEAISGAKWLNKPARLLDEINRAHPKLLNLLLHLADGKGFNVKGDLFIPVGKPYYIEGQEKRYSFTIATRNPNDSDYSGTFEEDIACVRRLVISVDFDELVYDPCDNARLLANRRRAKTVIRASQSHSRQIIEVYEALPYVVSLSGLAQLFLNFLAGRNICTQTRNGRLHPHLVPNICEKCHLAKSHRFCGRIGGLTKGLLTWTQELACAITMVRASMVLNRMKEYCMNPYGTHWVKKLQQLLDSKKIGENLYEDFREFYLGNLCVTGEDVKAAYVLIAPTHVWHDSQWLKNQAIFEGNPLYLFRNVANDEWASMLRLFQKYRDLVQKLANGAEISGAERGEIEKISKTEDPAFLALEAALRSEDLSMNFDMELSLQSKSPERR